MTYLWSTASKRLDASDDEELEAISVSLGVSRQAVLEAVALVGSMPNALIAYFASKKKRKAWPPSERRERAEASAAGRKRRREGSG